MKSRWAFPALMAVVIPSGLVLAAAWAMKRYMQDGRWAGASRQRWDWPSSGDRRWAWPESGAESGQGVADTGPGSGTGTVDVPSRGAAAGDGTRIVH